MRFFSEYIIDVDHELFYADIVPTWSEWIGVFNDNGKYFGKFQLWSKCSATGTIRSYFYVDSLPYLFQYVNSDHASIINENLIIYNDIGRINTSYTRAGGEFFMNISTFVSGTSDYNDFISVSIEGFKTYIKIPFSICTDYFQTIKRNISTERGNIMSIWTYDVLDNDIQSLNSSVIGFQKHFEYHFCLLNIAKYEVLVQGKYIKYYMQNPVIYNAVIKKQVKFVIKNNHITQYNETHFTGISKYQAVYMNLQILRYWNHDVRLLLWDTDEYIHVAPTLLHELQRNIKTKSVVSFQRKSIICLDCDGSPDYTISFYEHVLGKSSNHIPAKVSLNPNEAGLMLVHFALLVHGSKVRLDSRIAYLCHFENYYRVRVLPDTNSFHKFELPHQITCSSSTESWWSKKLVEKGNVLLSFYFQFEAVILATLATSLVIITFAKCMSKRKCSWSSVKSAKSTTGSK